MKQIRLKQITNECGDIGLMEYACHPSLDKRIFREWNGHTKNSLHLMDGTTGHMPASSNLVIL